MEEDAAVEDDKKQLVELKEKFLKEEISAEEYTREKNKLEDKLKSKEDKLDKEITESEEEKLKLKEKFLKEEISPEEYEQEKDLLEEELEKELEKDTKKVHRHKVITGDEQNNTWKYASAILSVVVIIMLINFGIPNLPSKIAERGLSEKQVSDKALSYINSNLLKNGDTASLVEAKETNGVYQLKIKLNDQTIEVYATKDGKFLFPSGIDTTSATPQDTGNQQPSNAKQEISTDDDPALGPEKAPITIVEFSDYQCPFCARVEPTIKKVLENYKDNVRLVYRDFPLGFHQYGQKSAEATECADEQGKFWEYHDLLFEKQSEWSPVGPSKFSEYAKDLGLDVAKFTECLDSGKYKEEVQKDQSDGQKYGVSGTPAFFINGVEVSGAQPYSAFEKVIEQELKKAA